MATRYHLKLYPLPEAIHGVTYYYSLSDALTVAEWLGNFAPELSPAVELSVFLLTAPPELREKAAADGGKLCMVSPAVFADSAEEAKAALQPFADCSAIGRCLLQTPIKPLVFEEMFDASGVLWPEGMRNRVKAIFF